MPSFQKIFIDDSELEAEILHDRKWPRLLVKPTGEILSVGMAKRIMRYFNEGISIEEVPLKFREEWNRVICPDTAEAVFDMDFDTTELPVPSGEHLVCGDDPAIEHSEFVRGTIIPSGIYYEIINLRDNTPAFVEKYLSTRWGFELDEDKIVEIWNEWIDTLPTNEDGVPVPPPGDVRPAPPARHLAELGTEATEAQRRRSSSSFPLPLYSPRPTWGKMTFKHPREVGNVGGQLPPYHDASNTPNPPEYSPGLPPLDYCATNVPNPPDFSRPPPVDEDTEAFGEPSRRDLHTAQESPTSPADPAPSRPTISDPKPPGWFGCDETLSSVFDKQDIIEYLNDQYRLDPADIPSFTYPYGPYEPVPLASREIHEIPSRIRCIISEGRHRRMQETQIELDVDFKNPTPWETIDESMAGTVRDLFEILQPDVITRVPYFDNLTPSENAIGLVYHLTRAKGLNVMDLQEESSNLTAGILKLFHKLDNHSVRMTLSSFGMARHSYTFASFVEFLAEVAMRNQMNGRQALLSNDRMDVDMVDSLVNHPYVPRSAPNVVPQSSTDPWTDFHLTLPVPAGGLDEPVQYLNAITSSKRMQSANGEALEDLHSIRIARHTRIIFRLQDWLTELSEVPENEEDANLIAGRLIQYAAEIDRCRQSSDVQPQLWRLGHVVENMLSDLEIGTFADMLQLNPDDIPQQGASYNEWQAQWVRRFKSDIEQLHAEFYCLTHDILRVRTLPAQESETRVVTHDHICRDLLPLMMEFDLVEHGEDWPELREQLRKAASGQGAVLDELIVGLRYKVRNALLALDSLLIVPQKTITAEEQQATNHADLEEGEIPEPSAFTTAVQDLPDTPVDNTDQPPVRALDMGALRRITYSIALRVNCNAMIARQSNREHTQHSPSHSTTDDDSDMNDANDSETSDSSGGVRTGHFAESDEEPLYIQPPRRRPDYRGLHMVGDDESWEESDEDTDPDSDVEMLD